MPYRHVVALGSSIDTGYARLVAEALDARLTDLSAPGATTATTLEQQPPDDADLVLVTVGGNDLGYAATVVRLALANRFRGRWYTRPLGKRLAGAPVPILDPDTVVDGLGRIVEAVRARVPAARIVLVDYLTIFDEKTPVEPFDEAQHRALRALGRRVNGAFAVSAQATGVDLIQASVLSTGHGAGSADPWVNGFASGAEAFRPAAAGLRAIADELLLTLAVT